MHCFILLTVSGFVGPSGVTGCSQWNATATTSNPQSRANDSPTPPLIGTSSKMHSSHRSRPSMIWQMSLLWNLKRVSCHGEHTRVLLCGSVSPMQCSRSGSFHNPDLTFPNKDPTCILLCPCVLVQEGADNTSLSTGLFSNLIATALSTQFGVQVSTICKYLQQARVEEWGRVQRGLISTLGIQSIPQVSWLPLQIAGMPHLCGWVIAYFNLNVLDSY